SMLISFALICSCQKQDSAADQQLAQQKAELDAREKALDEREKEKALAEREKATPNIAKPPAPVQAGTPDSSQVRAERDRRLKQLPPEVHMLLPDPARVEDSKDEKDKRIQERLGERQRSRLEELQRMRSGASGPPPATFANPLAAPPAVEATSPPSLAASPAVEAASPTPSPTPQ
ncbi:MAG: hypothetical protein DME98_01460, partial [Verrucomicrobia bacterium]